MKSLRLLLAAVGLVFFVAAPVPAYASVFEGIPCDELTPQQQRETPACADLADSDANPLTGPEGIIMRVTNILAVIAGILAVIIIIWGGFTYITSSGDSNKTTTARNMIIYSAIGLVVIVLAQTLIVFILNSIM